jgi:hypothetical protein
MRPVLLASVLLLLDGCLSGPPMTAVRTNEPPPVPADRARVVFFMALWESDPPPFERHPQSDVSMAAVVVDDRGLVVGTVKPGTFVIADVEAGDRDFFAEDARFDTGCASDCQQVGALAAKLVAGRTYGIIVEFPDRFRIGAGEGDRNRLDLVRAGGAPIGRPGWTWLRLDAEAGVWTRDHVDRVWDIVRDGKERMRRATRWDASESSIGP